MTAKRTIAVLLGALLLLLAGCGGGSGGGSGGGGKTLKIGEINPFSGPNAAGGEAIDQGYQLAVEEANAKGGVLGKQIELIKGDASMPPQGISEVNRLATSQKVDLFAGTYVSGVAETASQTALRTKKLYWDTNALAQSLTQRNQSNFVRSGPSAQQFGSGAADAVTKLIAPALKLQPSALKVFISHENSAYGTSVSDVQRAQLQAAGVQIVGDEGYTSTSTDLSSTVLRGKQAAPDVWIETGYVSDGNLLLRTAQQQNFRPRVTVFVGTGDTSQTLDAVGAQALQRVVVVAYPHTDVAPGFGPGAQQFLAAYQKKFGHPPVYPQTMTAYVGMQMLLAAVAQANSVDPAAVRRVLSGIDKPVGSFATGFGEKYDSTFQNTLALPTAVQWQNGRTVTVYPMNARPAGAQLTSFP